MRDPVLDRLLHALDQAPAATLSTVDQGDLAQARARAANAARLLGGMVQESPYLAFAGRVAVRAEPDRRLAASA